MATDPKNETLRQALHACSYAISWLCSYYETIPGAAEAEIAEMGDTLLIYIEEFEKNNAIHKEAYMNLAKKFFRRVRETLPDHARERLGAVVRNLQWPPLPDDSE